MLRHPTLRVTLFASVIIGGLLPATALAERIRCTSQDYRYAACRAPGRIVRARVVDRHSKRPCDENRTWGYRGNTLWVDQGCDAEFEIDVRGSDGGYYPPGGAVPRPPYGTGPRPPGQYVPDWAEGRWRATSGRYRMDISSNGRVNATFDGRLQGYWNGDSLVLDTGQRLRVERQRNRNRIRVYWPDGRSVEFKK